MDFNNVVKSRKSVRNFSDKKPDWREIIECIDAARYAPTAGKNFTLKFILVSDEELILKIAAASEQSFIAKAKYIVVAYSDPTRLVNLFGDRGSVYSRQQSGAAIQNFLLAIEDHGLSTCWVGHCDDVQIKTELKIKDNMELEAILPVGYEEKKYKTKGAKTKPRIDLDRILFFDEHGKKQMKPRKGMEV